MGKPARREVIAKRYHFANKLHSFSIAQSKLCAGYRAFQNSNVLQHWFNPMTPRLRQPWHHCPERIRALKLAR
jgi:hypothetical protein